MQLWVMAVLNLSIFPDSTDKVNRLVENGVVIQGTLTPVLSILNHAKRVII